VGSLADELGAGVKEGRVRRSEIGAYMRGKGFQDSATSRALGAAVKKWGSLAKVDLASGPDLDSTEEAYVPCGGGHAALGELLRRPAADRFAFRLGSSFQRVTRHTESPIPLYVDVIANESSTNCKAKVSAIPSGDREVQVYWQPHDALSFDLNQGETARAEVLQVDNPGRREIANYQSALVGQTDSAAIGHIEMRLEQTYGRAARLKTVIYVRTPDVQGNRINVIDTVNVLVLTVYSTGGLSYAPFLVLRRNLEESHVLPILRYESKLAQWSARTQG
jgi:hypothetical protein